MTTRIWSTKVGISLGIVMVLCALVGTPTMRAQASGGYDILFSIPVQPGRVEYSQAGEDRLQWGPKALAIAPDGSFVLANTLSRNILHLSSTGRVLKTIDVSNVAQGILDIKATAAGIFALDGAAYIPSVLHLTYTGTLVAKHEVPASLRDSLTGLAVSENGRLLLEIDTKISHQLLDSNGELADSPISGPTANGQILKVQSPEWSKGNLANGSITVGKRKIDISVPNVLASPRILGVARTGIYALIDELMTDDEGTLRIDAVVRHYSFSGRLLDMARFPLKEQVVPVDHPFAVGPDGSVYALLARTESVSVARLTFSSTLNPILPTQHKYRNVVPNTAEVPGEVRTMACTIYRNTIGSNAAGYTGNSKTLNATNTDGACGGRGKPRYIGGPGNYSSVAYDWGGNDTPGEYNTKMDQGNKAGDIDTLNPNPGEGGAVRGVESCSRGIDCSGLVSRSWGKGPTPKYGTTTLNQISESAGAAWQTKKGDAMNLPGSHTRLINSQDSSGPFAWESTTDGNFDRVIYRKLAWNPAYNNYQAIRFVDLCDK